MVATAHGPPAADAAVPMTMPAAVRLAPREMPRSVTTMPCVRRTTIMFAGLMSRYDARARQRLGRHRDLHEDRHEVLGRDAAPRR